MADLIDGLRIRSEAVGQGAPALVFVHGYACDRHDWPAQVAELSDRYRTIVLDLPGHGESDIPASVDLALMANAAIEAADRHHPDGPVILIGHSMGCRVVLDAAHRYPDRVAAVVLIDGSRMADSDDPERAVAAGMKILSQMDVIQFSRMAFEGMFPQDEQGALKRAALARVDRLDPAFAQALMVAVWRWDAAGLKPALENIAVPILMLQSTHIDHTYKWEDAGGDRPNPWIELVKTHAPQTRARVIPGAGHFTHIDAPEQVNAELAALARQVAGGGTGHDT